jgi:hypothetical protein
MKNLLEFLKALLKLSKTLKHGAWFESMDELVIKCTCLVIKKMQFVVVSCDEGTIIDNQFWFNIHACMLPKF